MNAIACGLKGLMTFSGREARGTFWIYAAVVFLGCMVAGWITMIPVVATMIHESMMMDPQPAFEETIGGFRTFFALATVWALAIILLLAAAVARRLHDTGRSGLWGLLPVIPLTFGIGLFVRLFETVMTAGDISLPLFASVFIADLVYFAGLGALVFLLVQPSNAGANRFGPPPNEKGGTFRPRPSQSDTGRLD